MMGVGICPGLDLVSKVICSRSNSSNNRFINLIRSSDKVYIGILSKAKTPNPSHCYLSII